ncbi:diaminopimelate epimerase [Veillonella sp. YH-vei2232]|jgi:diaminopimelate epimerase|uniref:Diaminopimelate epimerase n=1 Tax=Veillonella absiana TaxID=3079305 RepID=A0ABU3Z6N2_9FIRM|nr:MULTISPECIES: diaminopimelate epimerase [unclassified Veillonella]NCB95332.1 diaminopimelate epimerase [Negativicutes bacterium]MBP6922306.1 diaminopimelate epimerase [Veillonella sp.]MBP8616741.1 diaminopimelate epimerase [Veillonella sp.]MBP9517413.1 diaminopimelate epimerase [Veillonella sp.]MBP9551317.1 diaminopimelate epimerase [Veillonella sp.]
MKLTKMHGLGNDFVVFSDPNGANKDYTELAIKLCHRQTGIGADGLAIVVPSDVADIRMRIINSDGSEAEMCGNAIRCFSKYAYEHGQITTDTFTIETLAGIMKPSLTIENGKVTLVTVDMGKPFFNSKDIPMDVNIDKVIDYPLELNGEIIPVSSVLMGVPHTEVFVEDVTKIALHTQGPQLETHPIFPRKSNINYVEVVNDHHIKVRTWERGAGATLACGTGSCASAVMSYEKGLTGREVDVELYLGTLHISYREDSTVFMTGPAEEVFETELNID